MQDWIPIPLESKDRILTDEQFANYCYLAIQEIQENDKYGAEVKNILEKVSQKELIGLMLAVAKQESGGKPLGQFEYHRYEHHQKTFSLSIFHVLMKGPGLTARQGLNMTEGQLYHPKNAAKLFLAYLIENSKARSKKASRYLPIEENYNQFASFYNGKHWKKTNPHYVKNLSQYYQEAIELLDTDWNEVLHIQTPVNTIPQNRGGNIATNQKTTQQAITQTLQSKSTKPPNYTPAKEENKQDFVFLSIGNNNLYKTIREANWANTQKTNLSSILKTKQNIRAFVSRVLQYLEATYADATYYPSDQILIWLDQHGTYLIFKRDWNSTYLRLPKSKEQKNVVDKQQFKKRIIGNKTLWSTVKDSNWENSQIFWTNILKSNRAINQIVQKTQTFLKKTYGKGTYYPSDTIEIGHDKHGAYLVYGRKNQNHYIRL